jgi:hypothetical protein
VEFADSETVEQWDALVSAADGGFLFQTKMWADFWSSYIGGRPSFWVARGVEGSIHGILMELRKSPAWDVFFERPFGSAMLPAMRSVLPIREALGGPLTLPGGCKESVQRAFALHLRRRPSRVGVLRKIIVTSPAALSYGAALIDEEASSDRNASEFESCGYGATLLQTLLVDLQKSEDEHWSQLHRSARKTVSRAQRDGIVVRTVTDMSELRHLYEAVIDSRKRMGLRSFGFRNWELMWEWLNPTGAIHMFVAEVADQVLACLGVWAFGKMIQEFASVRIVDKSPAGDLLKWEVIQWGRSRGYDSYDLAGVNLSPDASDKEKQIARHKLKWGGVPVSLSRYSCTLGFPPKRTKLERTR